ncbi:MAG: hypothetical protein ABI354_03625 [Candidatus Saccharimonadales bacterium]
MEDERPEDLNKNAQDIEERIKHMMDPKLPDIPPSKTAAVPAKTEIDLSDLKETKVINLDNAATAPELPSSKAKPSPKKSRIRLHNEANGAPADPEDIKDKLDQAIDSLGESETTDDQGEHKDESLGDSSEPALDDSGDKADAPLSDKTVVADSETDKAVEDIIAKESDDLLEAEDAVRDSDDSPSVKLPKTRRGLKQTLKDWWAKPAFRWGLFGSILIIVLAIGIVPTSRYFLLNTAGVRAASSIKVLDGSTQQPLKNVQVTMNGISTMTNADGVAKLQNIKLGNTDLVVNKRAFAPIKKALVIGWGSNKLGDLSLKPTGTQYVFTVVDFLSGKPITTGVASSIDADAKSDEKGIITLTVDRPDDQLSVTIKADGFRDEVVSITASDTVDHTVKLVPSKRHAFISKRSGSYDLYSVYIDGKGERLVLPGSGAERENNLVIAAHKTDNEIAYVSNRGNQHNSDGFVLSNLVLINLDDNTTKSVATSERIQLVDWSGDNLVYVQVASGASASNPKRYRLMSYNYKTEANKELASSNYFNDVIAIDKAIYYAPSSAYQSGKVGLYKMDADGSGFQTVFNDEVWNIYRTSYDHLALSVQQQWYDYQIGSKQPTKLNNAPASQNSRVYENSPDGKHSAWIDSRDGKGVLISYDVAAKNDVVLQTLPGISGPLEWLNNTTLVYRVKTNQETADYAVSTNGGAPVKIRDVTSTSGIDRWYYY